MSFDLFGDVIFIKEREEGRWLSIVLFARNEIKPRKMFGAGALLSPSFYLAAYSRVEDSFSFAFLMFSCDPIGASALQIS